METFVLIGGMCSGVRISGGGGRRGGIPRSLLEALCNVYPDYGDKVWAVADEWLTRKGIQ